jgi:hypothetical protein
MNITLSLADELVKRVRKIAVDRETTLTGMGRDYLKQVAEEHDKAGSKRRDQDRLERTFERFSVKTPRSRWTREELHARD